jgi:NCS1 family nucleobase:cation symporter-1
LSSPADVNPVDPSGQSQPALDLFLIFVGANIVATTFQVGASLAESFTTRTALVLIAIGSVVGAALVAVLAPIGSRLRVPSVIAARPALGTSGAAIVAILLYVSNFAWIALNNVIAASACARAFGVGSQTAWAVGLGLLATIVVWRGPQAVARADRVAVPLMLVVAVVLTVACIRAPIPAAAAPAVATPWWRGLDIVVGYQVSWLLMFADYSRYTRSPTASATAVFVALAATSLWIMPLGALAAAAARSSDPGSMLAAVGLGESGALLLTVATLTTNFVNIYMSSLAWKSLVPRARDEGVIWTIGLVGTLLSAVPGVWLAQYTNLMILAGAILLPIGGILIAHYYLPPAPIDESLIRAVYDPNGPFVGFSKAGLAAWVAGAVAFFAGGSIGGTLPALGVSVAVYVLLRKRPPAPSFAARRAG